jgi:hypothetical protein
MGRPGPRLGRAGIGINHEFRPPHDDWFSVLPDELQELKAEFVA